VRRAFTDIMASARTLAAGDQIEGVLVQSMVSGGIETMVGVADDPLFGPVMLSGWAASTSKCWATCASASRR